MKSKYLCLIVIGLAIVSIGVGAYDMTFNGLLNGNPEMWNVLTYSRIPRLLSILLSASALALAGMIMQKVMNNPYVSPSTTVTVESIRLGITLGYVVWGSISITQKYVFGITTSFIFTLIFITLSQVIKKNRLIVLPLFGIVMNLIIESFTSFLALKFDLTQIINSYFMGSFSLVLEGRYEWLYLCIPLIIIGLWYSKSFHIMELGEGFAKGVGVNTTLISNLGIGIVCALVSLVIINVGSLPFIGLLIPNMVRSKPTKHPFIKAMLLSMILVLISDILARIIVYPYEITVSIIISIIGSLGFIYYLTQRSRYEIS